MGVVRQVTLFAGFYLLSVILLRVDNVEDHELDVLTLLGSPQFIVLSCGGINCM